MTPFEEVFTQPLQSNPSSVFKVLAGYAYTAPLKISDELRMNAVIIGPPRNIFRQLSHPGLKQDVGFSAKPLQRYVDPRNPGDLTQHLLVDEAIGRVLDVNAFEDRGPHTPERYMAALWLQPGPEAWPDGGSDNRPDLIVRGLASGLPANFSEMIVPVADRYGARFIMRKVPYIIQPD